MKEGREELLKDAKEWLADYEKVILPCLKSNLAYAPSDIAFMCERCSVLTLMILTYLHEVDLTEEEIAIKEKLENANQEIYQVLNEKEAELDELYEEEELEENMYSYENPSFLS